MIINHYFNIRSYSLYKYYFNIYPTFNCYISNTIFYKYINKRIQLYVKVSPQTTTFSPKSLQDFGAECQRYIQSEVGLQKARKE